MGLALHPCGEMVNTTSLSLVSCRFDSCQGYKKIVRIEKKCDQLGRLSDILQMRQWCNGSIPVSKTDDEGSTPSWRASKLFH